MNCPNCNTQNLPDDARFCPNCGTEIKKCMEIRRCEFSEGTNGGKSVTILWNATNVDFVKIDGRRVSSKHFESSPETDHVFQIEFFAKDGHTETINLPIWYDFYSKTYYTTKEEYEYVHHEEDLKSTDTEGNKAIICGIIILLIAIVICVISDKLDWPEWIFWVSLVVGVWVGYGALEDGIYKKNSVDKQRKEDRQKLSANEKD